MQDTNYGVLIECNQGASRRVARLGDSVNYRKQNREIKISEIVGGSLRAEEDLGTVGEKQVSRAMSKKLDHPVDGRNLNSQLIQVTSVAMPSVYLERGVRLIASGRKFGHLVQTSLLAKRKAICNQCSAPKNIGEETQD